MESQFKRILNLVRATGDRMVVTDPDGKNVYVIMGLDQYEDFLSLNAKEDDEAEIDEIDWKPEDYGDLVDLEPRGMENGDRDLEVGNGKQGEGNGAETDDLPDDLREAVEHDLAILEAWRKETEVKSEITDEKNSQEKPKSDDDEERFYLEPIE